MRASECVAVALDLTTGALALRDGAPYLVSGAEAVAVLAWGAARSARGGFFTDLDSPLDLPLVETSTVAREDAWLGGVELSTAEVEAQLRRTLGAVPGVGRVASLRVRRDALRQLRVDAVLVTAFDDVPPTNIQVEA